MSIASAINIICGDDFFIAGYTGSRNYRRRDVVRSVVGRQSSWGRPIIVASGDDPDNPTVRDSAVDHTAIMEARRLGMATLIFEPDWSEYGRSAGPRRNTVLVEQCHGIVAFWDGHSRGTADTILAAFVAGKLRRVYDANARPIEPDVAASLADRVMGDYSRVHK